MDAQEKHEVETMIRLAVAESFAPVEQQISDLQKAHRDLADQTQRNTILLAQHAELHTQHAAMISTAQGAALKALSASDTARAEQDMALKSAIEIQNGAITSLRRETSERLDTQDLLLTDIKKSSEATHSEMTLANESASASRNKQTEMITKLVSWHNHPLVKFVIITGVFVGAAIGGYIASHH